MQFIYASITACATDIIYIICNSSKEELNYIYHSCWKMSNAGASHFKIIGECLGPDHNRSVWCRRAIERLKHLGVACKSLTIPQSCYPLPVQSICIQTDIVAVRDPILQGLASCDGVVIRQLETDAEYDFSRGTQLRVQVMQAYRHDYQLPDKDWLPQSKELLSVMKERLSHVWMLANPLG